MVKPVPQEVFEDDDEDLVSEDESEDEDNSDDENLGFDIPTLSDDDEEDEDEDEEDEDELVSDDEGDTQPRFNLLGTKEDALARLAARATKAPITVVGKTVTTVPAPPPGLTLPTGLVGTAAAPKPAVVLPKPAPAPVPAPMLTLVVGPPPPPKVTPPKPIIPITLGKAVTPPKLTGIPQLAGLAKPTPAPAPVPVAPKAPTAKMDINAVLANLPGVTIAGLTPGVAPVVATLDDLLVAEVGESPEDFAARKVLTHKLAALTDLQLNNSAAVTLGLMLSKKLRQGVTYSPELETTLNSVLARL